MLALFLRHYRRFAMFSGGAALFVMTELSLSGAGLSMASYVGAFAVTAMLLALLAAGVYIIAPQWRGLLEITGMAALITAAFLYFSAPTLSSFWLWAVGIAFWSLLSMAIGAALNGRVSQKIGSETTWRDRHSGHISYPARLVWRHVVPGAAEPGDHCTGMMARYDEDDEDPDTVHVTFKGRKDRAAQYTLTFLERDFPSSCRFFFQGTEADGTVVDGIFSLRCTVLDRDSCFISFVEERAGLKIGSLVERWFDDALGYQYDKLIEILDKRYSETYGIRKPSLVGAE